MANFESNEKLESEKHIESLTDDSLTDSEIPTYAGASGSLLLALITIVSTLGFTLFGYDQGVMSGLIEAPQFFETFPAVDPSVMGVQKASVLAATYVSLYEIGCAAGAILALSKGDKFGRKMMIKVGATVLMLGVLIQITSIAGKNAGAQFIIGRIVTGFGTGCLTSTIPSYHAECCRAHNRGLLVVVEASMIASGTAIAYWVDYAFSFNPTSLSWRIPILLQVVFALIVLVGIHFLPDSPRWLALSGQMEEAQRVVAALEPAAYNSEVVLQKMRVIQESIEGSKSKKMDLFTSGPSQNLRRLLLACSSQFLQQVQGCNAIIYFAPVIFSTNLKLDRNLSLLLGGANVTVYAFAAFLAYGMIERVGRRKLFLIGCFGQAFAMFMVMGFLIPGEKYGSTDTNIVKGAAAGLFLFLAVFAFTWLPLPWLYAAEITNLRTRTNSNAVSTITNWLSNFAVVQVTPPLLTSIGLGTFALFGAVNVVSIPLIYFFYPETAGRSLEELDVLFAVGYLEGRSYVKVGNEMPKLSDAEVESENKRLALLWKGTI